MKNSKISWLVEGSVMIALATVLSFIKVYKLPQTKKLLRPAAA